MSASRTNVAVRSTSVYRATVSIGFPVSPVKSRTAWMSRIAASPRLMMATRLNTRRAFLLTARTFLVAPPSCLYSLCLYGSVGTPAEGACHSCAVVENKQTTTSVTSGSLNRPGVQRAGQPWRLTTAEYLAGPVEGEPVSPGQVPDAPWDPALADAMQHRCERVNEE